MMMITVVMMNKILGCHVDVANMSGYVKFKNVHIISEYANFRQCSNFRAGL